MRGNSSVSLLLLRKTVVGDSGKRDLVGTSHPRVTTNGTTGVMGEIPGSGSPCLGLDRLGVLSRVCGPTPPSAPRRLGSPGADQDQTY